MTTTDRTLAVSAAQAIRDASGVEKIDLAVTLGSGWKQAIGHLGDPVMELLASTIPGFQSSTVPGHSGQLTIIRTSSGHHVLVIGARTHLYEGHGVSRVVHGVRVAANLGSATMVLTNGAGGINPQFIPGHAILISDQLNLTARSPLVGAEFVDLSDIYCKRLRDVARTVEPGLAEGVYAQLPGPQYETPAEIRMLRGLGADLVGMSTSLEAIAARAAGMEVFGISLVTNLAAGIQDGPLDHSEVLESGAMAQERLGRLLSELITHFLAENRNAEPSGIEGNR